MKSSAKSTMKSRSNKRETWLLKRFLRNSVEKSNVKIMKLLSNQPDPDLVGVKKSVFPFEGTQRTFHHRHEIP
ncbi:hypothetical protein WN48_00329 [Eufriesea mexicana]|uniref:Uncharacterized protein n=1 Tax=Eufriesea mexicana TaxID=516756 RepID=A0A310SBZ3_9HYME|nr:hypothetical protein WN48_00329 [Eufriesea mexicana]